MTHKTPANIPVPAHRPPFLANVGAQHPGQKRPTPTPVSALARRVRPKRAPDAPPSHAESSDNTRQLLPPLQEGLYASPEYLARHGTPETPADLAQHRLIGYRYITANRILPLLLDDHGDTLSVEMATPLISNDIDVMADAIRAGIGIGRLFTNICAQQRDHDRFRPVLRDYWRTYPGVYLYHLPQAQKARRVRVLIDFLLEKAAAMLGEATPQNVL